MAYLYLTLIELYKILKVFIYLLSLDWKNTYIFLYWKIYNESHIYIYIHINIYIYIHKHTHTHKVKWKSISRVWLFTPWTIQSMKFSRPEYWSGYPFPSPGDLLNSGIEPRSPALQADALPAEPQGRPRILESIAYPFSSRAS